MSCTRLGRLGGYVAAAAATSAASAGVQIIDLASAAGNGVWVDVSAAVSAAPGSFKWRITSWTMGPSANGFAMSVGTGQIGGSLLQFGLLSYGQTISATPPAGASWESGAAYIGSQPGGSTRYVGFRLPKDGQQIYGWFEVTSANNALSIGRWGYESDPGTGIAAPAGSTPAVPGLGGLAALAMGAAGVRRNRHRVA